MEIRKIQLTGGSSYVLTLPKEWIVSHQLKKNDPVGLMTQADGTLLVTPRTTQEQFQLSRDIVVDGGTDPEKLFRMLVGTYIMGFNTVEVRSRDEIPRPLKNAVVRFTQTAIGPEIIEDAGDSIIIKDLLNPIEMPFGKTVRRMHMLARAMHQDALAAMLSGDAEAASSVIDRDRELDRLHWLVARQSNLVLREAVLAKKMEVSLENATNYALISRIIERIGDHSVRIAENAGRVQGMKLDKGIMDDMKKASQYAISLLDRGLESWFQRDVDAANDNVDSTPALVAMCDGLAENIMRVKGPQTIYLGYIIESIRRTGEYSGDISELVINNAMNG